MSDKKEEITGYLIRFGSPEDKDLQGEYFTADTEITLPQGGVIEHRVSEKYDHAIDEGLFIPHHGNFSLDEIGISLKTDLKVSFGPINIGEPLSEKDLAHVRELLEKKAFAFAPIGKWEANEDGEITKIDVESIGLTVTPADPKAIRVRIIEDE